MHCAFVHDSASTTIEKRHDPLWHKFCFFFSHSVSRRCSFSTFSLSARCMEQDPTRGVIITNYFYEAKGSSPNVFSASKSKDKGPVDPLDRSKNPNFTK